MILVELSCLCFLVQLRNQVFTLLQCNQGICLENIDALSNQISLLKEQVELEDQDNLHQPFVLCRHEISDTFVSQISHKQIQKSTIIGKTMCNIMLISTVYAARRISSTYAIGIYMIITEFSRCLRISKTTCKSVESDNRVLRKLPAAQSLHAISFVKSIIVTHKFGGRCYLIFQLIILY